MSDPVTPSPVVTPGLQTSEGKFAVVATVLSILAAVVPGLAALFTDLAVRFPGAVWIGAVVTALGVVGSILTALGYGAQRTALKVTALKAP